MKKSLLIALALAYAVSATSAPDEERLGKAQGYPRGTPATYLSEPYRVGSFSAMDSIFTVSCAIAPSSSPRPLVVDEAATGLRYGLANETVEDYLRQYRITGLMIVKDDHILLERYQYARSRDDRFLGFSMSKTVLMLAIGVAIEEGRIGSIDDNAARYVAELAGTGYGETSIRNLLRMSSGIRFDENYSGADDLARWHAIILNGSTVEAAKQFNEREAVQGTRFRYASSETEILNLVLRAATGKTLCKWVEEKIWQPMGAESVAMWLSTPTDKVEYAQFGLNATLRDYARLAMLLANDGKIGGRQVVPRDFLLDATRLDRQPPAFRPGSFFTYGNWGYGYQTWIFPGDRPQFALRGIFGQAIFVDPQSRLALIQTSVGSDPIDWGNVEALWQGIVGRFGQLPPTR